MRNVAPRSADTGAGAVTVDLGSGYSMSTHRPGWIADGNVSLDGRPRAREEFEFVGGEHGPA